MVLTVTIISGLILSATAIAGLLVFYQVRESNDVISSTVAVFAADAGLEWGSCNVFKKICGISSQPTMTNGARVSVTTSTTAKGYVVQSQGFSGRTVRALETTFLLAP